MNLAVAIAIFLVGYISGLFFGYLIGLTKGNKTVTKTEE